MGRGYGHDALHRGDILLSVRSMLAHPISNRFLPVVTKEEEVDFDFADDLKEEGDAVEMVVASPVPAVEAEDIRA
ncbi:hypothetical protein DXG01_009281 [Tephrocybe rancida]|nr:hypothetical protein DXG01_009281 [Tephrocybe rancida]